MRSNHYLVLVYVEPCSPPRKCAVSNNIMFAVAHNDELLMVGNYFVGDKKYWIRDPQIIFRPLYIIRKYIKSWIMYWLWNAIYCISVILYRAHPMEFVDSRVVYIITTSDVNRDWIWFRCFRNPIFDLAWGLVSERYFLSNSVFNVFKIFFLLFIS